jgi:predicted aldo/keto reductase-like oxidoreductase
MQKRKPGNSDLTPSALGLGCMGTIFGSGPAVEKQKMIAVTRATIESGITCFDTVMGEPLATYSKQGAIHRRENVIHQQW